MRLFDKDGVLIWVDPEWDEISRRLFVTGDWEAPQAQLINMLGRPDWTFLDIGAHIGYFSLLAAPHYGQVIAFEPTEYACELHKRSVVENNFHNVVIYDAEVHGNLTADVVKIDIDGGEEDVFAAHPELLEAKAIFFEYVPALAGDWSPITYLQDAGYEIRHEHGQPLTDAIPPGMQGGNYIALKGVHVPCVADVPPVWAQAVTVITHRAYDCQCEVHQKEVAVAAG